MQKRLNWVDNLKAFTIILVIIGHCLANVEEMQSWFDWIYSFHMPLFFVISGITYSFSSETAARHRLERIMNLALIYLIQSIIYIVLNVLIQRYIHTNVVVSFSDIRLLPVYPVAHFWYIQALIIFYVADALFGLMRGFKYFPLITASFASVIMGMLWPYNYISELAFMFLFFEFGRYCFDIIKLPFVLFVLLFVSSLIFRYMGIEAKSTILVRIYIAFCGAFFFLKVFYRFIICEIRGFSFMGRYSLWIYIFHSYFTAFARTVAGIIFPGNLLLRLMMGVLAGIIGSILVLYIMSKLHIEIVVSKPLYLLKRIQKNEKNSKNRKNMEKIL